ncbi:hypothetical protein BH20GEM2_BH20GEM2_20310 [soil metagenome]
MALADPLPAGLEALNAELEGVGFTDDPAPETAATRPQPWWWRRWWVHQNLRDQRAEAFATRLPAGSYEFTYLARATTPGDFVVPPPRAEEMYHPEIFGRGASTRVTVTPAPPAPAPASARTPRSGARP